MKLKIETLNSYPVASIVNQADECLLTFKLPESYRTASLPLMVRDNQECESGLYKTPYWLAYGLASYDWNGLDYELESTDNKTWELRWFRYRGSNQETLLKTTFDHDPTDSEIDEALMDRILGTTGTDVERAGSHWLGSITYDTIGTCLEAIEDSFKTESDSNTIEELQAKGSWYFIHALQRLAESAWDTERDKIIAPA